MKQIIAIAVILLCAAGAKAQDPLEAMQEMLRQGMQERMQRHQNEMMRLELERRQLQEQSQQSEQYQRLSDSEVMAELMRYCPTGEPPCRAQPPQALLQEASRRGLIEDNSLSAASPDWSQFGSRSGKTDDLVPGAGGMRWPESPFANRRSSETTRTTGNQNNIAPRQPPGGASATVKGEIPCSGTAVGLSIEIDGEIDAKTVESVREIFDRYHKREAEVRAGSFKCDQAFNPAAYGVRYVINSAGGNVSAAMAIGRIFRRERAHLQVEDNGVCLSACVLILAGVIERAIDPSARIGIHRPYLGTTPERPMTTDQVKAVYKNMLESMRNYLREMNVSERLADDMLATEPERVHILTQGELKAYGLAGIDPAEQQIRATDNEARDVQEANKLSLDRREYTRRKALGIDQCLYTSAGNIMDSVEIAKCRRAVLSTGRLPSNVLQRRP